MRGSFLCTLKRGTTQDKLEMLGFKHTGEVLYYCRMVESELSVSILIPLPIDVHFGLGRVLVMDEKWGKVYDSQWHATEDKRCQAYIKNVLGGLPIDLICEETGLFKRFYSE